jgi:hypothetical protein
MDAGDCRISMPKINSILMALMDDLPNLDIFFTDFITSMDVSVCAIY